MHSLVIVVIFNEPQSAFLVIVFFLIRRSETFVKTQTSLILTVPDCSVFNHHKQYSTLNTRSE